MPQRMTWIYICSLCQAETDDRAKSAHYELSGPGGALEYDLCPACEGAEDMQVFFAAGIPLKGSKKPRAVKAAAPVAIGEADEVACEFCSEVFTRKGIGLHQSTAHNIKSKSAIVDESRGHGDHVCPDCGYGARNPQGLGAHRRVKHGVKGPKSKPAKPR